MEDFWLNQSGWYSDLRVVELLDERMTGAERRFDQALKAIVARIDALSAQVAEVRAAVGLPVEEPPAEPGSEGPASAGWDS